MFENWAHGPRLPRTWLLHDMPASRPSSHVPWPPLQETGSTATINVGQCNVIHPSLASTSFQSKPVCSKCIRSAHPDSTCVEQPYPISTQLGQHQRPSLVTTICSNKDHRGGRRQYPSHCRPLHRQPGHQREEGNLRFVRYWL